MLNILDRRIFAIMLGLGAAKPTLAYDWSATVHVTMVETTYAPGDLPIAVDVTVGSCAVGTALLHWTPQGATTDERIASYDAALAAFLASQANGTAITLTGNNAGCQILTVQKK